MRNILRKFHTAAVSLALFVTGCSNDIPENFDQMTVQEQSLYQPERFRDDRKKDSYRSPYEVLKFSGVKPGDKVLDLLGGGGYYTELFNYIVGEKGKVYIQNNTLFLRFSKEELDKRLNGGRLKNVVRIDSEFADMKLPKNMDMIFIGLSYHDIYVPREDPVIEAKRDEFIAQMRAALKPGGKLLIIDHAGQPGSGISTTPKLHRIDEDWTKKDLESGGFKFIGSIDALRNPDDDYSKSIWAKGIIRNTDRFIHLYEMH